MSVLRATALAIKAHGSQVRKYNGLPYVLHTLEVAETLRRHGHSHIVQSAAILHDVLEDTDLTIKMLDRTMGKYVTDLVVEVTDKFTGSHHGNRQTRKGLERERLAMVSEDAQLIKVADLMSNTRDIVLHDPSFARVYLDEKEKLLNVLTKARKHSVWDEAWAQLQQGRLDII